MRKIPTTVANEITVHDIQGYFDKPQAQGLTVGRKPGKEYNHQRTTRAKDKPNTPPVTVTAKRNMQVMLSVFQSWRLQRLNPYKELRAIL